MNKNLITSNFIWRFLERTGAQLVALIVSIVLARLLAPETYGIIALVTVFTNILNVFIDSGMGSALIQKKDADDLDFSSVFYFNVLMCLALYGLCFISAPFIASFYGNQDLTAIIRVLSLTLIISGVKNIQQAYVSRNMLFKRFFFATLGGTIVAAIIGITMAYLNCGVWALVAQQLINATIDTIILWITVKWRPRKEFSFSRLKSLLSYGWKLLISALLDTGYNELRQLIIGKIYTSQDLAYYNQGDKFPKVIVSNINSSIDSVLLPSMSQEQDNRDHVKSMTRRAIMVSTFIMAPMMIGLMFMASNVVKLLLTEKWLECVPYLQIFCFTYMFYPIHTANLNAIKAMGRSDLFLKLEVIKKVMGVATLLCTMMYGPFAIALGMIFTSIMSQIINSWPNKKLLNYSYLEQLKDIMPALLISFMMGCCVYLVGLIKINCFLLIVIQIVVGVTVYFLLANLFKLEAYNYCISIVKNYRKSKAK